jgi:hypothetical protein
MPDNPSGRVSSATVNAVVGQFLLCEGRLYPRLLKTGCLR